MFCSLRVQYGLILPFEWNSLHLFIYFLYTFDVKEVDAWFRLKQIDVLMKKLMVISSKLNLDLLRPN